jgi:hypothetical protein
MDAPARQCQEQKFILDPKSKIQHRLLIIFPTHSTIKVEDVIECFTAVGVYMLRRKELQ